MDPISFVVTTIAGAALKKVADDSYVALKSKLIALLGVGAVQAVEAKPESEPARQFLAAELAGSPEAQTDTELPLLAARVADELAKLPDDEDLGGNITVRDIRAGRDILVRHLQANPGTGIVIGDLTASGKVTVENIVSGWKPTE